MRPRGLRAPWRKVTNTYATEVGQPSRMVERRRALEDEVRASGTLWIDNRHAQ